MVRINSLGQSGNKARIDLPESQRGENRIDSLAKQLAVAPSRRGVLRLMAGGTLGALVSGLGLGSSGAGLILPRSVEAAKKGNHQNSKQEKKDEPKPHQDENAASNNDGGGGGGDGGDGGDGEGQPTNPVAILATTEGGAAVSELARSEPGAVSELAHTKPDPDDDGDDDLLA
jgi:hypothetical protein